MNRTLTLSREEMRKLGYAAIDQIVGHFDQLESKPVTRKKSRKEMEALFREPIPESGQNSSQLLSSLKSDVFENMMHLDHPRFFPFVPGPSNYISVLGDLLATGHNAFAGTWLESSSGTQIELVTIDWLKEIVGFPKEREGILTSGGSMANLTALIVCREVKLNGDAKGVLYCSEQTHSSIEKAIKLLGKQLVLKKVGTNNSFQINIDELNRLITSDLENGGHPIGVIGNAGTTNSGAVDDLLELREVCNKYNLWFHIDGAYGCPGILSKSEGSLFRGIESADSVSMDPHKWLFQPYEIGCVMIREKSLLLDTFSTMPEYLKDTELALDEVNFFNMGPQMTRSLRALKLWLSFKVFGLGSFRQAIEHGIQLARYFQRLISVSKKTASFRSY